MVMHDVDPKKRTSVRRRIASSLAMLLYQFLFVVAFVGYLPWLLWRGVVNRQAREGYWQRTGRIAIRRFSRDVVWIHGVSVGEVKAAANIIARLRVSQPELQIVLSTTTRNGHRVARQDHPDLQVIYYPLDFWRFPGRALDRVRPSCVLLMELEIWPNFLQAADRRGIPVAVINGRISERTFRGYSRARGLLPQLDLIRIYCVQDQTYRQRLLALGVQSASVFVTGNMKYDSVVMGQYEAAGMRLRTWLSTGIELVMVAGSTHENEELRLCDAVKQAIAGTDLRVRIVLVPRHPERGASLSEALRQKGLEVVRWTENAAQKPLSPDAVVMVDTIGLLQTFYAAADVTFVGGSLIPRGGQNMLEPAAQGRAVLFGPHVDNFRNDVDLLLQKDAALQVNDDQELARCLRELFESSDKRDELGKRAKLVITENQGATMRTLQQIASLL
jgi:3-deoxy-D-manno-octulosonic-acid transferase